MAKKRYHDPFENGLKSKRPGFGVPYTEPFPKNGFIDHCIMKDYPQGVGQDLNNPYTTLEDIDKINNEDKRILGRSAAKKSGPY